MTSYSLVVKVLSPILPYIYGKGEEEGVSRKFTFTFHADTRGEQKTWKQTSRASLITTSELLYSNWEIAPAVSPANFIIAKSPVEVMNHLKGFSVPFPSVYSTFMRFCHATQSNLYVSISLYLSECIYLHAEWPEVARNRSEAVQTGKWRHAHG